MEWILGLSILAIVLFIILLFILPFIITVIIASNKGYSGCLWFLIAAVLGWIAVIIVICMPNLKKQEQRHQETIAALTSQKSNIIVNNSSGKNNLSQSVPSENFRLDAIKALKAAGKPFDEYDVEIEMEKLKKEHHEKLAQEEKAQREEQAKIERMRREEEYARMEERKRIESEKRKKNAPYWGIATILLLILLCLIIFFLLRPYLFSDSNATANDEYVIINGVRWATRNVGAPGTFAENPESAGMFFQWNRRQGWSATSGNASGWSDSMPTGTMWQSANNPCPSGWRVPTAAEFQSLNNSGSVWTTRNGVSGRLFGREPNQLFLPAVGWRVSSSGALNGIGSGGVYWSSTLYHNENTHAMRFGIYQQYTNLEARNHAHGFSVRCVAAANDQPREALIAEVQSQPTQLITPTIPQPFIYEPLIVQATEPTIDVQAQREEYQRRRQQEEEARRRAQQEEARRRAEEQARIEEALAQEISRMFGEIQGTRGEAESAGTQGFSTGIQGAPAGAGETGAFNIDGRSLGAGGLVRPRVEVDDFGIVVVDITVDPAGNVIRAVAGARGTTTPNATLRRAAEEAARATRFNAITGTNNQQGTITYIFKLN